MTRDNSVSDVYDRDDAVSDNDCQRELDSGVITAIAVASNCFIDPEWRIGRRFRLAGRDLFQSGDILVGRGSRHVHARERRKRSYESFRNHFGRRSTAKRVSSQHRHVFRIDDDWSQFVVEYVFAVRQPRRLYQELSSGGERQMCCFPPERRYCTNSKIISGQISGIPYVAGSCTGTVLDQGKQARK